jgi:hypothetical protein
VGQELDEEIAHHMDRMVNWYTGGCWFTLAQLHHLLLPHQPLQSSWKKHGILINMFNFQIKRVQNDLFLSLFLILLLSS